MTHPVEMDALDRVLLNELQREIPHVERPFRVVAERVGATEDGVLDRLSRLRAAGIIRQVLSIFDTPSLGYASTLAAFRVPPERIEAVASIVNAHPGVSHNYERDHAWNLWFTIAVPPGLDVFEDVRTLARLAGAGEPLLLPTLRLYKIGVRLDMNEGTSSPISGDGEEGFSDADRGAVRPLTALEVRLVRCLQEDMPTVARPYAELGRAWGLSEAEVIEGARDFRARGVLRRTAAILRHRRAGFGANGMGIWAVPEERWDEVGERMASFRSVSHCYRRPSGPGWPYTHFTMVHARTRDDVLATIDEIARATGVADRDVLFSTREFKKTRLRFFTEDDVRWREATRT